MELSGITMPGLVLSALHVILSNLHKNHELVSPFYWRNWDWAIKISCLRSWIFCQNQKVKVKSLSRVRLFATPWTVAHQAPPSMGYSRQEYWSGLPIPSPGDLPDPGIESRSPTLQADALTSEPPGKQNSNSKHFPISLLILSLTHGLFRSVV